jgi:hypothetical protein
MSGSDPRCSPPASVRWDEAVGYPHLGAPVCIDSRAFKSADSGASKQARTETARRFADSSNVIVGVPQ